MVTRQWIDGFARGLMRIGQWGRVLTIRGRPIAALLVAMLALAVAARAQGLPSELCASLHAERSTYGATLDARELGALLNAVAWAHREHGWGLSAKPGGHRCPQPTTGRSIACDVLQRGALIWDVLVDAEGRATPSCGDTIGPPPDATRVWLAAVDPGGRPPPPDDHEALRAAIAHVAGTVEALTDVSLEHAAADERQLADLQAQLETLATSLEEHRAEARKVRAWAKDWRNWVAVAGAVVAGLAAR